MLKNRPANLLHGPDQKRGAVPNTKEARRAAGTAKRASLAAKRKGPHALLRLARTYHARNDEAGVRHVLTDLRKRRQTPPVLLATGEVLQLLGRHTEAVELLSCSRTSLPVRGWRLLARALQALGREGEALATLQEGSARYPEAASLAIEALRLKAALYLEERAHVRPAPPEGISRQVPEVASPHADASRKLLWKEAEAIIALYGDRPTAHLTRIRLLKAAGDSEGAREAAAAFLKAQPEDQRARLTCARLALAAGDAEEALEHYRVLHVRDPKRSEHLALIARCHDQLDDPSGVVNSLITLEALPESAARERARAQVLQLMQLHEEAMEALRRAVILDATSWPAWQQLVTLLVRLGRGIEARKLLEDLPRELHQEVQIALLRSRIASALGDIDAAVGELEKLGEAHSVASRQLLASHFAELGQLEKAEAEVDAAEPSDSQERSQLHLARADIARWRYDAAAMLWNCEAALAEQPDNPGSLMRMAHAHLLSLNPQAALHCLAQARRLQRRRDDLALRPRQSIPGQLANELMIDSSTTAQLRDLLARDDLEAIARIAHFVEASRTIGPSLALMIAARRQGLLSPEADFTMAGGQETPVSGIPAIIHQYWEGAMPEDVAAAIERMRRLNLWAEHRMHDRHSASEILERYGPAAVQAFQLASHPAERADIFRLAVLLLEGGFYVDVDDFCRRSLMPLGGSGVTFICRQEQQGTTGNNFIAAVPGHSILADALEEVIAETLAGANESIWLRSGPGLLTRATARHMIRSDLQRFARAHRVLTTGALSHFLAINRPLSYKLDKRNWARAEREGGHLSLQEAYSARREASVRSCFA